MCSEKNEKKYCNSDITFEMAKMEYQNQIDKTEKIDNKTNILLAITIFILGIMIDKVDIKQLFNMFYKKECSIYMLIIMVDLLILGCSLIIISFWYSIKSIRTRKYRVLDVNFFNKNKFLNLDRESVYYQLTVEYIKCVYDNRTENEKKITYFERSVNCLIIGVVCFAIYIILINII